MSDSSIPPIESNPVNTPTPGTQEASTSPSGYTTETKVGSMKDLKAKAPEVHQAMLEGIAQQIVNKMQDHQRRFKQIMRDGQRRD